MKYDTIVLGGGPGGYVAAIRLTQLGKSTVVVEKNRVGGVCLQRGCIPSKALIHGTQVLDEVRNSARLGIEVGQVQVSLEKLQAWKQSVVDRLTNGVETLFRANGVDLVIGEGKLLSAHGLEVRAADGSTAVLEADNIIVATGSRAVELPSFPFDGHRIFGSEGVLSLQKIPKRMLAIGGGVIGLELGTVYAKLGTRLTVVEMMDQLLPGLDKELVRVVKRKLRKLGVEVHIKSRALDAQVVDDHLVVRIETPRGEKEIEVDCVMVTVGRRPNSQGLGLEETGVKVDSKGFIVVDHQLRTSVPNIYAIGDVIGQPMLAHKASKQGIIAAEIIAGLPRGVDYMAMPSVIFTDPEVATVGLTLAQAKASGIRAMEASFPFSGLGRALTMDKPEGMLKLVVEQETNLLLGGHIAGAGASNLIGELALALEMGATAQDVALTVHPHPTLTEAVMEAAEAIFGQAIHAAPTRKKKRRV